jgi:hypothetical protein
MKVAQETSTAFHPSRKVVISQSKEEKQIQKSTQLNSANVHYVKRQALGVIKHGHRVTRLLPQARQVLP